MSKFQPFPKSLPLAQDQTFTGPSAMEMRGLLFKNDYGFQDRNNTALNQAGEPCKLVKLDSALLSSNTRTMEIYKHMSRVIINSLRRNLSCFCHGLCDSGQLS